MPNQSEPFYPLTEDNHAALVVVTAVIFLIYAYLGIIAKLIIRLNITSMKDFDLVLLGSIALYSAQTACVIAACNDGLGQHRDEISADGFVRYSKLIYASRILGLLVNATTKVSLCLLIRQINNQGLLDMANKILGGTVIVWTVAGVFATAFQCPLPEPWLATNNDQCPNQGPIFVFNGVMNILTDLALCILPVAMMWEVQTPIKRKAIVLALFGTRFVVPIVTIPSLSTARYLFGNSDDSTWLAVSSMIWLQISLGLSVLTVCIPSLKGVIDSLLGSTAVAAIGAPYDLRNSGKGSGLEMTPLGGSSSKQTSRQASGLAGSTLRMGSKTRGSQNTSWNGDRDPRHKGDRIEEGDSVRKLTEGVLAGPNDFDAHYDDRRTSASRADSRESSEAAYHM
ncbi:hypothetical protein ACJ41O_012872 [Fusarium nematophilum]